MQTWSRAAVLILGLSMVPSEIVMAGIADDTLHTIESARVKQFTLSIYLPPYYISLRKYPVIYFNDGQHVFGKEGLGVDLEADALMKHGQMEPIIVVGIHSDHERTSFYVPYEDEGVTVDFGFYRPLADWYTSKIIRDIMPYVNGKYSTDPRTGIAGYSFGGLHATWAALNYPEHFTFSGALSPSYWVNDFEIFDEGKKARMGQVYYFDVGTGEWNYYVPMLLKTRLSILRDVFYFEANDGEHDLADWRGTRIRNLLLLFAGKTDWNDYSWKINLEVIRSKYNGKVYLRINPVITYSNGLVASISYAATFALLNPEDGVVNKDGSFRFTHTKDLKINVTYLNESKTIDVSYSGVSKQLSEK